MLPGVGEERRHRGPAVLPRQVLILTESHLAKQWPIGAVGIPKQTNLSIVHAVVDDKETQRRNTGAYLQNVVRP
jgi:hypothetical protein